jgi:hypothetical protein
MAAFTAAGGKVPRNLTFGMDNGNYLGWEELNGVQGFQPDGDYLRFMDGFGRKKMTPAKIRAFQQHAQALAGNGWDFSAIPAAQGNPLNVHTIVSNSIRGEWNQLSAQEKRAYPMLRAIRDVYAEVKANGYPRSLQTEGIAVPAGTDPAAFAKKIMSTIEWRRTIPELIPRGEQLLAFFRGRMRGAPAEEYVIEE